MTHTGEGNQSDLAVWQIYVGQCASGKAPTPWLSFARLVVAVGINLNALRT